ncbi:hypothetical protein Droror1_Dr00011308 [Drosera rotundifolia]
MERESSSNLIRDHEAAMQRAQIALRWARSASQLLSSQKSSPSSLLRRSSASTDNDEEEKRRMRMVIDELRMQLVRERVKTRKVKLCGLMELVLQVLIPVSLVVLAAAMIAFGVFQG